MTETLVKLDFTLSRGWLDTLGDADLARADETTLRYSLFLGDVTFQVAGADFSTRWGWVPVLDFALALHAITEALATEHSEIFEFTESEATIRFTRDEDQVWVAASYTTHHATITYRELCDATDRFVVSVIERLVRSFPELAQNEFLQSVVAL